MSRRPPVVLHPRDLELLEALVEHRQAVLPQMAHWLGVSEVTAARRLRRLRRSGMVEYGRVFAHGSPCARITPAGVRRIDSSIGAPGRKLDEYRHDVGVGWLWTAAREGALGDVTEVVAERTMRSHDTRRERAWDRGEPEPAETSGAGMRSAGASGWFGVGSSEPSGPRHYPDLLLGTGGGATVAVELELSHKSPAKLARIMDSYAIDERVDAVLYVVGDARLGRQVTRAAQHAGVAEKVHVRQMAPGGVAGVDRPVPERARRRGHDRPAADRSSVASERRGSTDRGRGPGALVLPGGARTVWRGREPISAGAREAGA